MADWLLLQLTGAMGYAKPLVLAAFVLGSVATVTNVYAGLAILFLLASIDGLLKGWFGSGILALLMKDYFVGLCLIAWLSGRSWGTQRRPDVQRVVQAMTALAIWVTLEVANPGAAFLASVAGARAWLIWLPVFVIVYDVVASGQQVARYAAWIAVVATLVGIYGLLQFRWGLNFLGALPEQSMERAGQYAWYGTEGRQVRVFGTTVSPARYGGLMAYGVLLTAGCALHWRGARPKVVGLAAASAMGCGLILSGSRTPMVAVCIGGFAAVVAARRGRVTVGLAVLALAGTLAAGRFAGGRVYERAASVWTDLAYTKQRPVKPLRSALRDALDRPLGLGLDSGVGVPYSLRREVRFRGHMLENGFARALGELGWPGLIVYVVLVVSVFLLALRSVAAARGGEYGLLAAGLFGAVIMQLVGTMTGPILYPTPEAILFMACLAFLARLGEPRVSAEDGAQAALPAGAEASPESAEGQRAPDRPSARAAGAEAGP